MKLQSKEGVALVTSDLLAEWENPVREYLGQEAFSGLSKNLKNLIIAMAASKFEAVTGNEAMTYVGAGNTSMAANVLSPTAGSHNGLNALPGTSGSGDRQYLIGLCIAIAAKTIGLEMVQTVPATSQSITIQYLAAKYQGGDLANAANNTVNVITLKFAVLPNFNSRNKYVLAAAKPQSGQQEFIELAFSKADRAAGFSYIFTIKSRFKATNTDGVLTAIAYTATSATSITEMVATGKFYTLANDLSAVSSELTVAAVSSTKAIENYVPNQTTNGMRRTLTRSEADAGTDRTMALELKNENFNIGNRTLNGHVSRLDFKRLRDQGIDALAYLTAAMKNEVAQEVNYQIVSAVRAYGLSNALSMEARGSSFNTFIGPKNVTSKDFDSINYATELFDKDLQPVTGKFADVQNLINTLQYETTETVGNYLAMLIEQAAYAIGTDSRYGEGDGVVLSASLAGFLSASKKFSKLEGRDMDMTKDTGAKLSGTIDGIKVYVDVQIPYNAPYVTVFRSNQGVKVDMPGIEGDNILIPGLAYLVKDLISSTELVPEGTGGKKIIIDSETEVVAIGERPEAGYLTFAFDVALPGLSANV
jgi:hypothetical protein